MGKTSGKTLPSRVDDIIKRVMKDLDMPEDTALRGRIMNSWCQIAGDASRYSRPHRFQGKIMIVNVSNPAWMNELVLRKNELIRRLERDVGGGIVKDIRFQLDREMSD